MIFGRHGLVGRVGFRLTRKAGSDLGTKAGLVELLLLIKKALLFLSSLLLMEALPLPFVETTGEGPRSPAHGAGPEEREELSATGGTPAGDNAG